MLPHRIRSKRPAAAAFGQGPEAVAPVVVQPKRSRERGGVRAGVFVREKREEEFQEGHCFCVALPTSVYLITSETVQSLRQFE